MSDLLRARAPYALDPVVRRGRAGGAHREQLRFGERAWLALLVLSPLAWCGHFSRKMTPWPEQNHGATREQGVQHFEQIVNQALDQGARMNHVRRPDNPNRTHDISIPQGDTDTQNRIKQRINQLGGTVGREPNAPTGPHWHLTLRPDAPNPTPAAGRSGPLVPPDRPAPAAGALP